MSRRKPDPLAGSWVEAAVALSSRPAAAVVDFLNRHDIRERALIARPVDIVIQRLAFSGEKEGDVQPLPFEFEWKDLGPGLWLIGSDRNSTGKTSLLGVMRWLLRGAPPGSIPPEVLPWIRYAELNFKLGGVPHRVSVDLRGGYDAKLIEARPGMPETDRIAAASPDAFADAMSEFMMRALDLDPILGVRRDRDPAKDGQVTRHRWPALFGAFHIGTEYSALLGDVVEDGLPNRMLNMFAGFQHAGAVASITHVISGLKVVDDREDRSRDAVSAHTAATVARLRAELDSLKPDTPGGSAADLLAPIRAITAETGAEYERLSEIQQRLAEFSEAMASARRQHNADRRALQNFKEAGAAAAVFRALEPTCCPRCDRTFGAERRTREADERACMVCGDEAPTGEPEDAEEVRAHLEDAVRLSESIRNEAEATETEVRLALKACEDRLAVLAQRLAAARAKQAAAREDEGRLARRLVVEAMIGEMERDIVATPEQPDSDDTVIAKACETVFRARLKAEQEGVLAEVEKEIFQMLQALGVPNLAGVRLTSNPHLKLRKGKVDVNYGDLSIGQKLRCKVALVVALMKVAHRRGIGRHPGILLIDTPGAQELADGDLEAMASGLASLCGELPTLQVFVATKRFAEFHAAVPANHRRIAVPGGTVW